MLVKETIKLTEVIWDLGELVDVLASVPTVWDTKTKVEVKAFQ